ncbi:MAG: hypothetical protein CHKLHMKO_00653 [Candidatus Argoarchaeum ethanivorans]|uniref:Uncharacterized protein n=1 Tax=Candidatus Argoarchaeum ethanivorans TaxID=2608793 RepID=A0A811TCT8_9EURY|nr:MAG: hypothetical protein CHKLHMKO_00653 [Candidatus Argoarchaeum ethanivorans]
MEIKKGYISSIAREVETSDTSEKQYVNMPLGVLEDIFIAFKRKYVTKEELNNELYDFMMYLEEHIDTTIQKRVDTTTKNKLEVRPLSTAIIVSSFATVVSVALSAYFSSTGSSAGITFLYPSVIGVGTTIFLLHEYIKKGHQHARK